MKSTISYCKVRDREQAIPEHVHLFSGPAPVKPASCNFDCRVLYRIAGACALS